MAINFDFYFLGIGYATLNAEFIAQYLVNGADDKTHNGFGRVPYATRFAEFRIVCRQESFIKMQDGIIFALYLAKVFENTFKVGIAEHFTQSINNPDRT